MMKRMVQVYGFHWILLGLFVVICLFAGFVVFPAIVTKSIWNFIAHIVKFMPRINIIEATLLWLIIFVSTYLGTRNLFKVSIEKGKKIEKDEWKRILAEAHKNGIKGKKWRPRPDKKQ